MKAKIMYAAISGLCIASFALTTQAEDYYSTQTPAGGYASTNSGYYSSGTPEHQKDQKEHRKEHNKFSISVNIPNQNDSFFIGTNNPPHHFRGPEWISMRIGAPIPSNAVVSGGQSRPPATLFVCRAPFRGGLHPGKLYHGKCNIGWGGNEISLSHYEVLISRAPLRWLPANHGRIPPGAIEGGYQQNGPLFICQADYNGGRHSGKIVGQNCNFGWDGNEISIPYYNVLVR